MQNKDDICFVYHKYADFKLPCYYPAWMRGAKSEEALREKQQETKPLQISGPSKNKEELLFILK